MQPAATKILEARFHPRSKQAGDGVVIGRVTFGRKAPSIEPSNAPEWLLRPFDAPSLMNKLRWLVEKAVPDQWDSLIGLRSDYWSFAEVPTQRKV